MSFKNKVVIVTGASSAIGAAIAESFSAEGARVVMVGRNETKLAAVAARCHNPLVLRADVSNDDDARRIIDQTIQKFGQVDVLVNNAGVGTIFGNILEDDIMKAYDLRMNVNLRAVIYLTKLAAPHLINTKGNIVNISSVAANITLFNSTSICYHVAKAALNHFSICAAQELGRRGVRVNIVDPGQVRTDLLINKNANMDISWYNMKEFTVLERIWKPDEIANIVLFLASDQAKEITASNYVADNGVRDYRNLFYK